MINLSLVGGANVIRQFEKFPPSLATELRNTIQTLSFQLQSKVQQDKLSGQVLKTKTGTLRRSISHRTHDSGNATYGVVGTNSNYGMMHEFGFKGTENIKSHLRTIKMAWGKSIKPRQVTVKAHTRKVDYPERSFLRSALKEMETQIVTEIDTTVQRLLNE